MANTFTFDVEDLLGLFTDEEIEADDPAVRFQGTRETADDVKCGGCNWTTSLLYVNADSKPEAEALIRSGDAGLCGECYADYLSDVDADIADEATKAVLLDALEDALAALIEASDMGDHDFECPVIQDGDCNCWVSRYQAATIKAETVIEKARGQS